LDKNLAPKLTNVASYIWFGDTSLAVLLANKTNDLCLYNMKTEKLDTLVKNVGASFAKVPSENALYFTRTEKGLEHLYRYNIGGDIDTLVYLAGGCTEFAVAIDGSIWAANRGVVYRWPRAGASWEMMKDFGSGTVGEAYRVAVSRDMKWVAVVTKANY
jgi:hypothetical protein